MSNACNQDSENWETKLLRSNIDTIMLKNEGKYNSQFYNHSDFFYILSQWCILAPSVEISVRELHRMAVTQRSHSVRWITVIMSIKEEHEI